MKRKPAFTLVELLFVIAILGVLFALFLPVVNDIQRKLVQLNCQTNLRDIGNVLHSYASRNRGIMPAFDLSFGGGIHGDSCIISESASTPAGRHLLLESLIDCGATPRKFTCPAHPLATLGVIDDPRSHWGWNLKAPVPARGKFFDMPGYAVFTRQANWRGPTKPSMWASTFADGTPLISRSDMQGNPPLAADQMREDEGGGPPFYGFWHFPEREPFNPNYTYVYDARAAEAGGGGNTLFLGGEVLWSDWKDLQDQGPAFIYYSPKTRYYFARDLPENYTP